MLIIISIGKYDIKHSDIIEIKGINKREGVEYPLVC